METNATLRGVRLSAGGERPAVVDGAVQRGGPAPQLGHRGVSPDDLWRRGSPGLSGAVVPGVSQRRGPSPDGFVEQYNTVQPAQQAMEEAIAEVLDGANPANQPKRRGRPPTVRE